MHLVRVEVDFRLGLGLGGVGLGMLGSNKPPTLQFLQDYTHFSRDSTQIIRSSPMFMLTLLLNNS